MKKLKILLFIFIVLGLLFISTTPILADTCRFSCCQPGGCFGTNYGQKENCPPGFPCCDSCKSGELPLGQIGGKEGFGPWGNLGEIGTTIGTAAGAFTSILSRIIGVMTIVAGLWFIFSFIIGAYGFLTAGGDSKKMGEAASKITSALIGLVVIVAAYALISLIGKLLGFEDILQPQKLIPLLKPGG